MLGLTDRHFLNVCSSTLWAHIRRSVISQMYTLVSFLWLLAGCSGTLLLTFICWPSVSVAQQLCVLLHTHTHAQTHHLSWRVHGDRCLQVAVYLLVANLSYGEGFSQLLCTQTHTVTHACMHACKHGGVREKHTFEQQSEKKNKTLNPIKWELLAAVVGIWSQRRLQRQFRCCFN